ncbi:hypothetical protein BD324DRAFT_267175 [Kockovaella imperatae]|uniref:Uncharacterized protein n=1 Tax=Kockovaella imperatae TaxID=4999 RepID=A0A1Y1USP7_9TREE|nr:hypothetical protein BD324DRAFT_267175 [Kockovaella imperatae]ORX40225.1 hypothetical protein BD324DRAFT_267175 [Kockovaella imperatae]
MASAFMTQLQPWEENQSPSPKDEIANPYELGLSRSRSSGLSRSPPSPIASVNLARQLSGEVNASPPPWTRRPSMSNNKPARSPSTVSKRSQQVDHSQSPVSVPPVPTTLQTSPPPPPPPAAVQPASLSPQQLAPPPSRRHPGLAMTPSMSDSPSGSSASLNVDDLGLPNPAFRRRPGSNRSSMSQSSLTSEELWALESQSNGPADLSNPMRQSSERPLDTIRRMSRYMDRQYTTAMPGDVIWPSAPPIEEVYTPPIKSKSSTSIVSLGNSKRGTRRRASRQASQTNTPGFEGPKSTPASPADYVSHSARSSSTSLASQNVKAHSAFMKTPPVSYYSRDYMSSLAPREGGYAVAAQLASAMSSPTDEVTRQPISRASSRHAPLAPSSGMGRWSLDGGENFGRPYAMASAATTSTSFSGSQPISPEDSPPSDIHTSPPPLPTGAAAPATSTSPTPIDTSPTIVAQSNTVPVHPSPLKVSTASPEPADASTDTTPTTTANPTPTATKPSGGGFLGAIGFRKSMKNLNKASSKDDKALAAKVNQQRAQAASEASAKKAAEGKAAAERKAAAESKAAEESKAAAERKAAAEAAARDARRSSAKRIGGAGTKEEGDGCEGRGQAERGVGFGRDEEERTGREGSGVGERSGGEAEGSC